MTYNEMVQFAANAVNQRISAGVPIRYNEMICVVHTASNRIYTAFSSPDGRGSGGEIHAELNAVSQLASANDTAVFGVTVMSASDFTFIMPCANCISTFMNINPSNRNAVIVTPSNFVLLPQAAQQQMMYGEPMNNMGMGQGFPQTNGVSFNSQPPMQFSPQSGTAAPAPAPVDEETSDTANSSTYLKKKLSKLFDDDDDIEMNLDNKKENKKKFSLFRK